MNQYSKELEYIGGTRDVVAYKHHHPNGPDGLVFGYRGTAVASDIPVDAQLALNMKRIERLEEARRVTRDIRNKNPEIPNERIEFHGHSLGGWVAEGVGNDYPGSRTATIEPGAPIVNLFNSPTARAYPKRQPGANDPVRFVRMEDPVPLGQKNLGPAEVVKEKAVSVLNPLKNHFLSNNIPWYNAPVPDAYKKHQSKFKKNVEAAGAAAAGWVKQKAAAAKVALDSTKSWLTSKVKAAQDSYQQLKARVSNSMKPTPKPAPKAPRSATSASSYGQPRR